MKLINFKKLFLSFRYAFRGLALAIREQNFRIMVLFTAVVLVSAFYLRVSAIELSILILAVIIVLALEIVNTAVERILNFLHPEHHPEIGIVKDFTAASVLLVSLASAVVVLKIFLSRIF